MKRDRHPLGGIGDEQAAAVADGMKEKLRARLGRAPTPDEVQSVMSELERVMFERLHKEEAALNSGKAPEVEGEYVDERDRPDPGASSPRRRQRG